MVDSDELEVEVTVLLELPLCGHHHVWGDAVLFKLGLDERKRQRRADDRNVFAQPEQVWHSADVVFVSVGQHDREHVIHAFTDVAEVGQNDVDAWLSLFGKQHAAVDD